MHAIKLSLPRFFRGVFVMRGTLYEKCVQLNAWGHQMVCTHRALDGWDGDVNEKRPIFDPVVTVD